jgi:hypothetical protein
MPLSLRGLQRCVVFAFDAADSESLVTRSLRNCSFIALRGLLSTEVPRLPVDRDAPWMLAGEDNESPPLRSERVAELLSHPLRAAPTGVSISLDELRDGLYLWLVAHEADIHTLWTAARLPDLFGVPERAGAHGTLCLIDRALASLALLARVDDSSQSGELCILCPPGAEAIAERLQALLSEWARAGRPCDSDAQIRAFPRDVERLLAVGEVAINRRWTRFILSWQAAPPQPSS